MPVLYSFLNSVGFAFAPHPLRPVYDSCSVLSSLVAPVFSPEDYRFIFSSHQQQASPHVSLTLTATSVSSQQKDLTNDFLKKEMGVGGK